MTFERNDLDSYRYLACWFIFILSTFFQFMILIFKCLLVYILLYVTSCGLLTSFKRQVRSSSSRSEEGSAGMANVAVKQTRAENCN